jgi:hypothetical protein
MKDDLYNQTQERVYKHLQKVDWLLLFAPMVLSGILFIIVPLGWSIYERASGHPTEVGGFNFDGLVIIAGIFLSLIFCGGYFALAFILSILTRRNTTFRILLVGVPVLIVSFFCLWAYLNRAPFVPSENEQIPVQTEETPEETPAGSGRMKAFYRFKPLPSIPSRLGCKDSLKPFPA